ncbi:MAG: PspC domain-containing protein [Candidatus Cloacimonetes bacterium]|nr:PspC domain-containing protein [Candidatus Cloacimonadota bacterium]
MKNLHISEEDKMILGVCGGLEESFSVNANIFRIGFIISAFFGFVGIAGYIILGIILPKGEQKPTVIDVEETEKKTKLARSWEKRMIAGVCGGFSQYLGWDVSLIRIAFIAMAFAGGVGIFLYFFFWFIFPNEE